MAELLPCPFCGSDKVSMQEGHNFRWVKMACNDCDASCGEFRFNTLIDQDAAKVEAMKDGIEEWNKRALPY